MGLEEQQVGQVAVPWDQGEQRDDVSDSQVGVGLKGTREPACQLWGGWLWQEEL